ncbi:MAG: A/G-specific adenine glycosylase [Bacteroidaceae bacterium]|nr:A/G-specific adenine glycosylase [Bacteroidaceae bacterium]
MPTTFAHRLIAWYEQNCRDLPWRHTTDPYAIWLSEIILQQTRVEQGMDYYHRFLKRFPTVFDLAQASIDEVMRLWQGLGYYSRARNLHAAAQQIASNGSFPTTYEGIIQLKGVGPYTAAAIASFAYGLPHAVVDGNVYRVLSRYFDISIPIDTTQGKHHFQQLAHSLLPPQRAALFNQAMMDFGATCCTPLSPRCAECPLAEGCLAYAQRIVAQRPVKQKRLQVRTRHFVYIVVVSPTHLLLQQRPAGDIWQGLYQPPLAEFAAPPTAEEVLSLELVSTLLSQPQATFTALAQGIQHRLTHQLLSTDAYLLSVPELSVAPEGYLLVERARIDDYGMPQLVVKLLEKALSR